MPQAVPAIVVVSRDPETRRVVSEEIRKRYERDYLVHSREVFADALEDLERMQHEGSAVALILAGYGGLDANGVSFLARARGLHPRAKRAVVLRWGDFERTPEVSLRWAPERSTTTSYVPSTLGTRSSTPR